MKLIKTTQKIVVLNLILIIRLNVNVLNTSINKQTLSEQIKKKARCNYIMIKVKHFAIYRWVENKRIEKVLFKWQLGINQRNYISIKLNIHQDENYYQKQKETFKMIGEIHKEEITNITVFA